MLHVCCNDVVHHKHKGCSHPFANSHFRMGVTIIGFVKHFRHFTCNMKFRFVTFSVIDVGRKDIVSFASHEMNKKKETI